VPAVLEAIETLQQHLPQVASGQPVAAGVPQDAATATRAPRLSKQDGQADWTEPAAALDRRRRALEPWPRLTAFVRQSGGDLRRLVLEETEVLSPAADEPAAPGMIVAADEAGFVVACGGGSRLAVRRVVPEGRRSMTAAEFLRGSSLRVGLQLADPPGAGDTARPAR
jgi:methionyl-tRNA formyltransferase